MSIRDTWATPGEFIKAVKHKFFIQHFDLDVAADKYNTKGNRYYDESANGLLSDWGLVNGEAIYNVWCNPPYSNQQAWFSKGLEEVKKYAHLRIYQLLLGDFSKKYYYDALCTDYVDAYALVPRVNFIAPKGVQQSTNNRSSCLFVMRQRLGVQYGVKHINYWKWK